MILGKILEQSVANIVVGSGGGKEVSQYSIDIT